MGGKQFGQLLQQLQNEVSISNRPATESDGQNPTRLLRDCINTLVTSVFQKKNCGLPDEFQQNSH
jgi:hypothetical protein